MSEVPIHTTRSAARVLHSKQDTVKHWAYRYGVGEQPGGPGTPFYFTQSELRLLWRLARPTEAYPKEIADGIPDDDEMGV